MERPSRLPAGWTDMKVCPYEVAPPPRVDVEPMPFLGDGARMR
jgi:hypothetical protein